MTKSGKELSHIIDRICDGYFKSIDCGPGWTQLILNCHNELVQLDPDYTILQIKQKLGGLRYYVQPSRKDDRDLWEKMHDIVRRYENLSYKTCEDTGAPGVLMKTRYGQLKTLDPNTASPEWEQIRGV